MLKRVNRLRKRYQFNYVYKAGTHFSSDNLVLYLTPSKTKHIKVGIAVTKKIGHAVVRNRVRRQIRELIGALIPQLKQNCNIIIVAKNNITQASFAELSAQLNKLVKKADLFANEEIS